MFSQIQFPLRQPTITPVPAQFRPNLAEAEQVKAWVNQRQIMNVVHLTTVENFSKICQVQSLWSVQQLQAQNLTYAAFDPNRLDGHLNHINCSLSYYNFQMFYGLVYKTSLPLVILHIRPDYLWKQETKFCPVNAATNYGGYIQGGFTGLQQLFADRVRDYQGVQTRDSKPDCLPTSIQAEVLIPESIPMVDITRVLVRNQVEARLVREAGWEGELRILPEHFQYRNAWIEKGY